jgi:diaminohydroxyphosphoribosylaminopyrimidine deaminase/5-amino-6-(5-phosphoribosylamino)uracil reductase
MIVDPARDAGHMARALELARRGLWTTDPNPRVGCVIADDERVVAEGWHERAGGPHAEAMALAAAGMAARGATAYVTLEPCSHHGRTPPCADALIAAGISRVVYAMRDPNPRVDGGGAGRIAAAGIPAEGGVLEHEARELNAGFISRMTRGRPWVTVKLAASLTAVPRCRAERAGGSRRGGARGRAAPARALLGRHDRQRHGPRRRPRLDVRLPGATRQPLRVVLDSKLRTPPGARILAPPGSALIICTEEDPRAARGSARPAPRLQRSRAPRAASTSAPHSRPRQARGQ